MKAQRGDWKGGLGMLTVSECLKKVDELAMESMLLSHVLGFSWPEEDRLFHGFIEADDVKQIILFLGGSLWAKIRATDMSYEQLKEEGQENGKSSARIAEIADEIVRCIKDCPQLTSELE
jgi:hypothetical protein